MGLDTRREANEAESTKHLGNSTVCKGQQRKSMGNPVRSAFSAITSNLVGPVRVFAFP